MKRFVALLLVSFSLFAFADGTVTVTPAADPPVTWQFTGICINPNAGPGAISLSITWLAQSGREAPLDQELYPKAITLTGAEVVQFIAAVSPAGTDTFSSTPGAAKRFRQRATKWLIDNGKLARAANE